MNAPISISCTDLMGMPTDTATCGICDERKVLWGEGTLSRLEAWGIQHLHENHTHNPDGSWS
jgi:hypothetical protein